VSRFSGPRFSLARPSDEQTARFNFSLTAAYPLDRNASPLQSFRTPFLRQVRMTMVQFWGGRVQLDSFEIRRQLDNSLRNSSGFRFGSSASPGTALGSLYGFSLTLRPRAGAGTARSMEGCHCFGWLLSPLTK